MNSKNLTEMLIFILKQNSSTRRYDREFVLYDVIDYRVDLSRELKYVQQGTIQRSNDVQRSRDMSNYGVFVEKSNTNEVWC